MQGFSPESNEVIKKKIYKLGQREGIEIRLHVNKPENIQAKIKAAQKIKYKLNIKYFF